jgi:hypothetical protein
MKAKFKVGDFVTVNDEYFRQGKAFFQKELRHKKFRGKIVRVYENTKDEKDGFGEIWRNFYEFNGGLQICELFLKFAYDKE